MSRVGGRCAHCVPCCFFFFNDTATTEIYTLSLHDALPISFFMPSPPYAQISSTLIREVEEGDRKSTRLNSSHGSISNAAFCLNKKKTPSIHSTPTTLDTTQQADNRYAQH